MAFSRPWELLLLYVSHCTHIIPRSHRINDIIHTLHIYMVDYRIVHTWSVWSDFVMPWWGSRPSLALTKNRTLSTRTTMVRAGLDSSDTFLIEHNNFHWSFWIVSTIIGLFHLCKLPCLNSLVSHFPETLDLAFKLKRKKFLIEVQYWTSMHIVYNVMYLYMHIEPISQLDTKYFPYHTETSHAPWAIRDSQ